MSKFTLRLRTGTPYSNGVRRWQIVKCQCCGQPRIFSSFKEAKNYAKDERGHTSWEIRRVRK